MKQARELFIPIKFSSLVFPRQARVHGLLTIVTGLSMSESHVRRFYMSEVRSYLGIHPTP